MRFDEVKINKVDNGYIVSTAKFLSWQGKQPEQEAKVFHHFEEVVEFLFPKPKEKSDKMVPWPEIKDLGS